MVFAQKKNTVLLEKNDLYQLFQERFAATMFHVYRLYCENLAKK